MLRLDGLRLAVPGRVLVEDFSATIRRGEFTAVLGRNGSGKSSLVAALAGLASPASGSVVLDGQRVETMPREALARAIGVLPQEEPAAFFGTVLDYVILGRHVQREARPAAARIATDTLHSFAIASLQARHVASLSGGERQMVRLAQLFAQDPDLLLLDEPLLHLDLCRREAVLSRLAGAARDAGKAVVAVLHEPPAARRFAGRVLALYGDGRARELAIGQLTRGELVDLYGCAVAQDN